MSDLTFLERRNLEKLLQMGNGYVLDFTNRTLAEFVIDSTGRDVYDERYSRGSGSKANRLRAFWDTEPNHVVGKLIQDLLEYCRSTEQDPERHILVDECEGIPERLLQSAPVDALDAIAAEGNARDFEALAKSVHESIEKNEPEAGLDRLHTFVTKLVRTLSENRGVTIDKAKPLHSIFGEYVKALRQAGLIESQMTERILKSSISTMEAFNKVRNDTSLAHDNPLLHYDESLLIFNHVCSTVRFIKAIEARSRDLGAMKAPPSPVDDGASV